jgi:hypothetical protein
MRIKGSAATGFLLALTITLIPNTAVSAENVTPGGACKVLNQKVSYKNTTYSCIKTGKKLIWEKGISVAASTVIPTPTVAPTAIPTATPLSTSTPTATQELETPAPGSTCSRNRNSLKNC